MTASIEINGFNALLIAFDEFPQKLTNKVMKTSVRDAMKEIVLTDARRNTPVDSGQLRKSLKVRIAKGRGGKRLPRGVIGSSVTPAKTSKLDGYYGRWVFANATNRDGTIRKGTRTLRNALYNNAEYWRQSVLAKARKGFPQAVRDARIAALKYKG